MRHCGPLLRFRGASCNLRLSSQGQIHNVLMRGSAGTAVTTATAADMLSIPSPLVAQLRYQSSPAQSDGDDMSHITHNLVWGLWNEGNLFSLSPLELRFFITQCCAGKTATPIVVDATAKKSTLVRLVEEVLSSEQANIAVAQEDINKSTSSSNVSGIGAIGAGGGSGGLLVTGYDRPEETLDEADEYGDWGVEPGFEQKRAVDYLEIDPNRMMSRYEPLSPRAFQLLHSDVSSDVALKQLNVSRLPGQSGKSTAYVVQNVSVDEANKQRFRRAFEWSLLNAWNMNMPGEVNIGAGRVLYYRGVAKQNRNVLPIWGLQRHIYGVHPYVWFAMATDSNVAVMEGLAARLGMKLKQDSTVSYKVAIRRMGELLDCELNEMLQCTKLNRPWDRFLVTHYVRAKAPDLRYVVRTRHPIKKRVADAYLETDILRGTRESVHSVLSPELGDVVYCSERVIRKWAMPTKSGVTIQLVETRRTPLIITKVGDEGTRIEYEWIAQLPQRTEKINVAEVSSELWEYGNLLATELESGMEELMAHAMTAASLY